MSIFSPRNVIRRVYDIGSQKQISYNEMWLEIFWWLILNYAVSLNSVQPQTPVVNITKPPMNGEMKQVIGPH